MSLSRKTNFYFQPCGVWKLFLQYLLNICRFTCARWPDENRSEIMRNKEFLHVAVSHLVYRGYNDFVHNGIFGPLLLVFCVHPGFPFIKFRCITIVINGLAIKSWGHNLIFKFLYAFYFSVAYLFELDIKWLSVLGSYRHA
jgi:hypothetical protein